jgi:hypothetical protein
VTKMGAVKEYHYATIKGLPYKEYRREEWKRLFRSKSRRSAPLTEAEAELIHQLHRGGVTQAEIAKCLGTTRYRVQVCLVTAESKPSRHCSLSCVKFCEVKVRTNTIH